MSTSCRLWVDLITLLAATFALLAWMGGGSLLITWFVARLWIAPRKAPLVKGHSAESYG